MQYAVMQGCVRQGDALNCIWEAIVTGMVSAKADLKADETHLQRLLLTVWQRLTVLTVGPKHKHSAWRAVVGGCAYTHISRVLRCLSKHRHHMQITCGPNVPRVVHPISELCSFVLAVISKE